MHRSLFCLAFKPKPLASQVFQLPLGPIPLVVTRNPEHIREILGGRGVDLFPRPPHQLAQVRNLFGRAQIAWDTPRRPPHFHSIELQQ